ncbi:unnamed protein product [Nippostrongylus brasiliensis]|uniref:Cytochrome P450 n=1 Tax=Nippostrongylus brasiliensis TaxID=27835 RepID=A0A0N4XI37_NIPBR|nr:unnamed protein product [Nippostrongylus brasiliensis]
MIEKYIELLTISAFHSEVVEMERKSEKQSFFSCLMSVNFKVGAPSDIKCAYKERSVFCLNMKEALRNNNRVLSLLKESIFKDVRETLLTTNQWIRKGLRATTKPERLEETYRALDKELHALFQLGGSCSVHQNETAACKAGLQSLCDTTFLLMFALGDIAEGKQQEAITKAYLAVRDPSVNANETCPDLYYKTGIAILEAFGKSGPLV